MRSTRLVIRTMQTRDCAVRIELGCNEQARRYLGGALDRDDVEARVLREPADRPGVFGVESAGGLIGTVILDRRHRERPGHVRESGDEVELSYQFLPASWGQGYATEATGAVLGWTDRHLPSEPVVLCTQVANRASVRLALRLGFVEVQRFVEFGAPQWFGVRNPPPASDKWTEPGPHSCPSSLRTH